MSARPTVLFLTSVASTLLLLFCSFVVDSNGNLPRMGRLGSLALTVLLFGVGTTSALGLLVFERSRRVLALVLLTFLAATALPAFL
jgi:hypothetical protein